MLLEPLSVFISLTPVRPPPGSPAELCRLRADDEIVAVNGLPVAHMSCSQWTEKMTSSLQTGSVTMDIRRYGSKGEIIVVGHGFIFFFLLYQAASCNDDDIY